MKQSGCRDLDVFDFQKEDEINETYPHLSKLSNPKSEESSMIKYQFLQHASKASVAQRKEVSTMEHVRVVSIDDDDHDFISDITRGPLNLLENACSSQSEGFGVIPTRPIEQCCRSVEDGISNKGFSSDMEIKISNRFALSPGNSSICPTISESPSSNGSVDGCVSNGSVDVQGSPPSVPASPVGDNSVPTDFPIEDQSANDLEMAKMDTIVLHTDYVTYCNKYFPASLILFSKDSIKMKGWGSEEQCGAFRYEWDTDDVVMITSNWSSRANIAKVKIELVTKDASHASHTLGMSGVELLEFLVYDPDWSQKREFIMSLDKRYQASWSNDLNEMICDRDLSLLETSECSSDPYIPNFEEPFEEVVYPKGDVDAVSISKRDVDLLQPDVFINDTIIDFYAKYLKNRILPEERHRFHFFNSFFFRKLADLDKNSSSAFDSKAGFQRVRKWTRKVNIFEKDYIFIPVNYNLHWSLIVICHPGEVVNCSDENMNDSSKVPCILHMDSIRGSHTGLKDIVQSYLLEEWKERQKESSEESHLKFLSLRFLSLELPQQENFTDCGLFLLHYTELFIAEAPENFNPFMINKYQNFLKSDWFIPAEASLKRVHIQRLIYTLLESHSRGAVSPDCSPEPSALPLKNEIDKGIEIVSELSSPRKTCHGNISYSQSIQEISLFDAPLYRGSQCVAESSMGMKGLLNQSQHYDQGGSYGQLGCALSSVREEVETDENLAHSTLGQVDFEACQIGFACEDVREGSPWNSELSDQSEAEGNSSPISNHDSEGSEEVRIVDSNHDTQGASSSQNENVCELKGGNVDSLTESYVSASSDMMETPAEDSQELDKIYGSNDQADPLLHNPEQEERPDNNEHDKKGTENLVAKDSSSSSSSSSDDEEQEAREYGLLLHLMKNAD